MSKKILVKIISFLIIIYILLSTYNTIFATSGEGLVSEFNGNTGSTDTGMVQKVIGPVIVVIRIVIVGVGVIMLSYLGIQYMSAAPNEKAQIKDKLIAFAVGTVVAFGATTLISIVKTIAQNATS